MDNNKNYIFVKIKRDIIQKISHNDIFYIESYGDYVKIFVNKSYHLVSFSLNQLHQWLPQNIFYRCSNSFIVNVDKINQIEDNVIYFENNVEGIIIGQQYKKQLLQLINLIYKNKKS